MLPPSPFAFHLSQHHGLFPMSQLFALANQISFSNSPPNEYSGPISFRMDWFDFLAFQGTLKNLPQHHGSKASVLPIRWPEYWSFSCSLSPSSDYSGLISFRIDWFDLLAVQGTPKSFQPHSLKSSVQHSTFFIVQLSHLYMTTGKNMVLIIWTFLGKIMSLLFNMLSRFVIAFLPWSKHLLISWVQSPSTVILWPKKIKSVIGHCFHCFLICLPWIDGTRWHELHFLNVGF